MVFQQLMLVCQNTASVEQMFQKLQTMFARSKHYGTSLGFLSHLHIAQQCHHIANLERQHVSSWVAAKNRCL